MRIPGLLFTLLALALAAILPGCGGAGEKTLRFTAIPNRDTTRLPEKFGPVADYLAAKLGIPVEYVPSADYQASVEMFKNGDVELAWFGGLTGVQAREAVAGARAIVMGAGDREFYAYFVANAATGLERGDAFPRAIADLTFTFGSASSTSGRLMPEAFILEATGKTAKEFFATPPAFSGSHDQTAEQVEGGAFQAGVLDRQVYDARVAEGKTDPTVCRVIWVTPTFSDYNMTVHPDVDARFGAGTIDRLRDALVGMKDPALLAAFERTALLPAENSYFDAIRDVAGKLGMLR